MLPFKHTRHASIAPPRPILSSPKALSSKPTNPVQRKCIHDSAAILSLLNIRPTPVRASNPVFSHPELLYSSSSLLSALISTAVEIIKLQKSVADLEKLHKGKNGANFVIPCRHGREKVEGVEGIMAACATALHNVSLSGPTLFGQVINMAAQIAGQESISYNNGKWTDFCRSSSFGRAAWTVFDLFHVTVRLHHQPDMMRNNLETNRKQGIQDYNYFLTEIDENYLTGKMDKN
ncbi:unnamed protein product [Dovyalis caffra]|uniref:Copine C-terminal domain-containing protein n=1 Tax=Dovyalis caffra TaxID=77055 RepID=A0AAV1RZB3_9ROSI|nr:unnamed protein product [Dovyalis caffra]